MKFSGGQFSNFVNGYLPVVALLIIITILPRVFYWIAFSYEFRKTKCNVENAILTRYFYYQLANIYVTATAGSILDSLADILNHPSYALTILGYSIPKVVGYFVTLLMTKTFAGLPLVMLRGSSLLRMLFLKLFCREKFLTQRELDAVYKKEMLLYGSEYPSLLLVIVICFTYACIAPIILPFGALFFFGALIAYKKQVLILYIPDYESGGVMFPGVCHRTLIGLICGQFTLIGYTIIKLGFYQPLFLLPLPFITYRMMQRFQNSYVYPGQYLSLERAMKLDEHSIARIQFSEDTYRQPVLAENALQPFPYRVGKNALHSGINIQPNVGILMSDSSKIV